MRMQVTRRVSRGFLLAIGMLYVSFGTVFGLLQGGLPPILRAQGVDVGALGGFTAILLPFGLTFLWAPLVDRIAIVRTAPRIGWVVLMQAITAVLLIVTAYAGAASMRLLFALELLIALAAATMDIALDALASRAIHPRDRVVAGGVKVGALALGAIVGGGLFVLGFHQMGWAHIFLSVAALAAVMTLPILAFRSRDPATHGAGGPTRPSTSLPMPLLWRRILILSAISVPIVMLFGMNRVMLVDAGLSLDQIGAVVGTLSPVASLAATFAAIGLAKRFGRRRCVVVFICLCVVAATLISAALLKWAPVWLAVAGVVCAAGATSGLYVVICAVVLGWADTGRPATHYAMLYGISRLLALIVLMTATQAVPHVGWPAFYGAGALLLLIATLLLGRSTLFSTEGGQDHG